MPHLLLLLPGRHSPRCQLGTHWCLAHLQIKLVICFLNSRFATLLIQKQDEQSLCVYIYVFFFFSGAFTDEGERKKQAFVLLFAVFDETKSWYGEVGDRMSRERFKRTSGRKEYHTINGYVNSTLPGNEPQ